MPLYAYHCDDCDKEFETLVRSNDQPACPKCESTKLTRMLSLIATPARGGATASPMSCGPADGASCGADNCCFAGAGAD